jgi:hypothetical protein
VENDEFYSEKRSNFAEKMKIDDKVYVGRNLRAKYMEYYIKEHQDKPGDKIFRKVEVIPDFSMKKEEVMDRILYCIHNAKKRWGKGAYDGWDFTPFESTLNRCRRRLPKKPGEDEGESCAKLPSSRSYNESCVSCQAIYDSIWKTIDPQTWKPGDESDLRVVARVTLTNKVPGEVPTPKQIRPLVAPAYSYRFL